MRAMRNAMLLSAIATLIGVGLLLSVMFFNTSILSSNTPKALRLLVQALAPPADLYSPLGAVALDVSHGGAIVRFEFSNKYVGQHVVGLQLTKFSESLYLSNKDTRPPLNLKLAMGFATGSPQTIKRNARPSYDPFLGKGGGGFIVYEYNVPNDLPIAQKITCEVEVLQGDLEMQRTSGPIQVVVRKTSDK
jgi:hypothetical protein